MNLRETPIAVRSNNRRHELGDTKSKQESDRRTFHEEESMSSGDEYQSLRDNSNLQIGDHMQLWVILVDRRLAVQAHAEFALEKCSLNDDDDQSNPKVRE